ncbi:unnamed protein product, partial [Protopolystoma xenopodis]
ITTQPHGGSSLRIPEAFADDKGIFTAVATNPVGEAKTSTNLLVRGELSERSFISRSMPPSRTRPSQESPVLEAGMAPEFTRIFRDTSLDSEVTEEIRLDCSIIGNPTPTVTWMLCNRPISGDHRFSTISGPEPEKHSLIIHRPGPDCVGL